MYHLSDAIGIFFRNTATNVPLILWQPPNYMKEKQPFSGYICHLVWIKSTPDNGRKLEPSSST